MLETACEQFEVLQFIIRNEIRIVSDYLPSVDLRRPAPEEIPKALRHLRAPHSIRMALAKSFVANGVRARRICEHGSGDLSLDKTERRLFLNITKALLQVRDVNEHGFDVKVKEDGTGSRPSLHYHEHVGYLNETNLHFCSDTIVLMGPINLYDVYRSIARMRELAGWASLAGEDLHLWGPI